MATNRAFMTTEATITAITISYKLLSLVGVFAVFVGVFVVCVGLWVVV